VSDQPRPKRKINRKQDTTLSFAVIAACIGLGGVLQSNWQVAFYGFGTGAIAFFVAGFFKRKSPD